LHHSIALLNLEKDNPRPWSSQLMQLPTHPILRAVAWLSASVLVASCNSSDSRARTALAAYQAAEATNDLFGARRALLQLVGAKDDVADYWEELGKVQAAIGSYSDAYYAFTRAYELDRSNPELIRALAELALRSGDIGAAQSHAEELEVLAPGDPWVKMVKGWAAFGDSHYDEALQISDQLLTASPNDPIATQLKARSLIGLKRIPDAIDLLTKHVQSQPNDYGSYDLLSRIYESQGDLAKVAFCAQRMIALNPADLKSYLLLISAGLRSNNVAAARAASFKLLRPNASPLIVQSVLDLWADNWPSPQRIADARRLAAAAPPQQQLVYAEFLSRAGSPSDAIRLIQGAATLPVSATNAEANAVLGDALLRSGNMAAAKSRLDAVLAFDSGNATALRARTLLELRTGNAAAAIHDAQKLVTVVPTSDRNRLLLARAFLAAGQRDWANRTLWTAFQDIPADGRIYAALLATRMGNADAMNEVRDEFERQRTAKLTQGLL
jgi:predicted Zn-dependent protease